MGVESTEASMTYPRDRVFVFVCRTAVLAALLIGGLEVASADDTPVVRTTITYETGPAYIARNDGEYGATGTRYGADDVGQQANLLRSRRTSIELARGRHTAILLYAPFGGDRGGAAA
jgi:hypothetical protein